MLQIRRQQVGEFPSRKHQFKPGESGNPKGKPPGKTLTRLIEKLADEKFDGDKTRAEAFVIKLWDDAINGEPDARKHILERLEGKVTDRTEISGPDGAAGLTINIVENRKPEDERKENG